MRQLIAKTKRKIIQISATPGVAAGGLWEGGKVIALCNDGTVWLWCIEGTSDNWISIPNVPQDA